MTPTFRDLFVAAGLEAADVAQRTQRRTDVDAFVAHARRLDSHGQESVPAAADHPSRLRGDFFEGPLHMPEPPHTVCVHCGRVEHEHSTLSCATCGCECPGFEPLDMGDVPDPETEQDVARFEAHDAVATLASALDHIEALLDLDAGHDPVTLRAIDTACRTARVIASLEPRLRSKLTRAGWKS